MATAFDDDHIRCRTKVCVICYRKGERSLSDRELKWIQSNLIQEYNKEDVDFPIAICGGCHYLLSKIMSGDEVDLPVVDNSHPGRSYMLRSRTNSMCECKICTIAKSNVVHNSTMSKERKRCRPKSGIDKAEIIKICTSCFSRIGKGYPHHCTSRREKVSNMKNLLADTPTTSQKVASRIIKYTATPFLDI